MAEAAPRKHRDIGLLLDSDDNGGYRLGDDGQVISKLDVLSDEVNRLMGQWFMLKAWLEARVEDYSFQGRIMDEGRQYENVLARMQEVESGDG